MITDDTLKEWKRLADEWRTHGLQRPGEHVIRCQTRITADRVRISDEMGEAFPLLVEDVERMRRGLATMRALYQDGALGSNAALDEINEAVVNILMGREWSDSGEVKP